MVRLTKRYLVIGGLVLVIGIGLVIVLVLTLPSSTTTTKIDKSTPPSSSSSSKSKLKYLPSKFNSTKSEEEKLPNPQTEVYSVSALAIGDWGRTVAKDGGSCCQRRKSYTVLDYNAMEYTATLLGLAAAEMSPRPSVIIGHGDNFYWTGLQSQTDQAYRFQETYESKYADPSLQGIPWINVMGNHDYGGASFICSVEDVLTECNSTEDMLQHLIEKFTLQASYTSPNDNRWILTNHFYTYPLQSADFQVQIEIFNMDTNDADTHGASQICCQCYGYAQGDDDACDEVTRGDTHCAGGNVDMYDACMKQLKQWATASRDELVAAVNASSATWKLVNTHYSPYNHYTPTMASEWHSLLDGLGIQLFMYGHTHGEKHDYASYKTHFVENGAGGGIQNESPSGIPPFATDYVENVWAAGNYPYGIFSLHISKNWLQIRFLTFDENWQMNKDVASTVVGGIAVKHCWYIPRTGGRGKSCEE